MLFVGVVSISACLDERHRCMECDQDPFPEMTLGVGSGGDINKNSLSFLHGHSGWRAVGGGTHIFFHLCVASRNVVQHVLELTSALLRGMRPGLAHPHEYVADSGLHRRQLISNHF